MGGSSACSCSFTCMEHTRHTWRQMCEYQLVFAILNDSNSSVRCWCLHGWLLHILLVFRQYAPSVFVFCVCIFYLKLDPCWLLAGSAHFHTGRQFQSQLFVCALGTPGISFSLLPCTLTHTDTQTFKQTRTKIQKHRKKAHRHKCTLHKLTDTRRKQAVSMAFNFPLWPAQRNEHT